MKGLTLTTKEQTKLQVLNGVLAKVWPVTQAAEILGLSERHVWRLLASYREDGAAALAHGNRGRIPGNATPATTDDVAQADRKNIPIEGVSPTNAGAPVYQSNRKVAHVDSIRE